MSTTTIDIHPSYQPEGVEGRFFAPLDKVVGLARANSVMAITIWYLPVVV